MKINKPSEEEFLNHVRAQFSENSDGIVMDTDLCNLPEWSSLQVILLVSAIDDQFNVLLKPEDIGRSVLVCDLYNIVIGRM